ncbi:MAG: Mor transcription activator family protein [Anaerovoracaceae bacterium]
MDSLRMKLAQELTPEMVPEGLLREIAEEIGCVNLIKLLDIVNGDTVYLQRADNILRPVRDKHIREEFNGYNRSELAKKYNLSERYMRELCGEEQVEGQMSLF